MALELRKEESATRLKSWERCHNRSLDRSQHKPQQLRVGVLHCLPTGKCVPLRQTPWVAVKDWTIPCHLVDIWPMFLKSSAVAAMSISRYQLPLLPGSRISNELTNTKTDPWMLLNMFQWTAYHENKITMPIVNSCDCMWGRVSGDDGVSETKCFFTFFVNVAEYYDVVAFLLRIFLLRITSFLSFFEQCVRAH